MLIMNKEEYNILRLFRSQNVGPATFIRLLNMFGSVEDAIDNIDVYNTRLKNKIKIASLEEIDKEIVACSSIGAKIITYKNKYYPEILKNIHDFPPVLTLLGDISLFSKRSVSIVGARNASSNGCNFAKQIAKDLGEAGFVIISGFASGIDTSVHISSLNTGTIAVLGGSIDNIYPKGNEELYYKIKNKGLIISELPYGTPPRSESFPARNRIISGLSEAVIVIEAGAKSGSLHTARQAIEQGRELFVAPGNPYDPRCEGSNKLLKDGANVITSVDDIIYHLQNNQIQSKNYSNIQINFKDSLDSDVLNNKNNNYIENDLYDSVDIQEEMELENKEKSIDEIILSKLNHTPILIDLLCKDLNIKIDILNAKLIELELDNKLIIENSYVRIK